MFSAKSEIKFAGVLAVAAALLFLPYGAMQIAPKGMTRELSFMNIEGRMVWTVDALHMPAGIEGMMLDKVSEYYFFPISYVLYRLTGNRNYRTI